jgi:uncharacterized protein YdbL (DUF1318 family)
LPTRTAIGNLSFVFPFSRGTRIGDLYVNFFPELPLKLDAGILGLLGVVVLLSGCSPTVNLATPEPVKVDVAVRLDVYQKTNPTKAKDEQSNLQIAANRRERAGEIQQLKNDRVIGEDRDGYLDILHPPADPKYLAYAKSIVDTENADRSFLYLANAQSKSEPLELAERDYAQLWRDRAFPGEWVQKEDGSWIQK